MKRTLIMLPGILLLCGILTLVVLLDAKYTRYVAADSFRTEPNAEMTILDVNNTTTDIAGKLTFDTDSSTYGCVFIETSTGEVELDLLQLEYCTLEEIANFVCFMQIATELHLFAHDEYPSSFDPKILDVLIDKLISPKLIIKENER